MFGEIRGIVRVVLGCSTSAEPRAVDDRNMIYDEVQPSAFTFVNVISVIMCLVSARGALGPTTLRMSQLPKDFCVTVIIIMKYNVVNAVS